MDLETPRHPTASLDARSQRTRRPLDDKPVRTRASTVAPARERLEGSHVALEPLDPRRHGAELFKIGHATPAARDLWRYLLNGPFEDAGSMASWLDGCAASDDPLFFALRDKAGGTLMGMASYLNIRASVGVGEIGHIWLAPDHQRTRRATEALFVMMCHLMDDLDYRRLEWKCHALNSASRRAALRLGFRFEGVFFNHTIAKGRNRDTAWYSIIDSEWSAVRRTIQGWLAPENFDRHGRQKTSLAAMSQALW